MNLNLNLIKDIVLTLIAFILYILLLICHFESNRKDRLLTSLEEQISTLASESKKQNERFKQNAIEANNQVKALQEKTKNILKENVSHDCNKAIQWGIGQAKNF